MTSPGDPDLPIEWAGEVPGCAIGTELMAVRGILHMLRTRAREEGVPVPDVWLVVQELVSEIGRHVGPRCTAWTAVGRCLYPLHDESEPHHNGVSSWYGRRAT
jgi:hypothetical protein